MTRIVHGDYGQIIMMVYSEIESGQKPTEEMIAQVRDAATKPLNADEDCPEYDYEELLRMKRLATEKQDELQITLTVPNSTVDKAKEYGRDYKRILSRLLNMAIDDKEMVRRAMI